MKIKRTLCMLVATVITAVMIMPSMTVGAFNFTPYTYDDDGNENELTLYSEAVYMINTDTGDVVVDINSDDERVPASLTKIMTAVVLLEKFKDNPEDLKTTYVSSGSEAFDELYGTGASTADIQQNEKVSYYDLLCALLIPSSCEAANIIALNVADSFSAFYTMMNDKAAELGMEHSHFSNAHGLFTNQNYTSCKDMATLCQYAIKNFPVFSEIVKMPNYTMEATDYHETGSLILNTNYMLDETSDYYYAYCTGIKTGTLDGAGRCLASTASYDGNNYMIVSMGAPLQDENEEDVYYNLMDHKSLYQWAFASLNVTDFVNVSSEVRDVTVEYGNGADYVNLKPAEGYSQVWPDNLETDQVTQTITVKENIVAPIEKGDVLGTMTLSYDGKVLSEINLIATSSVERSQTAAKVTVAKAFPHSTAFKYAIAIILILAVGYTVLFVMVLQHKYVRKKSQK